MENSVKKAVANTETIANKSIKSITETAKNINNEVSETVETVVADVKANSQEIKAIATKGVKKVAAKTETVANKSINKIAKTAKNINNEVSEVVETIMEDVRVNGQEIKAVATNTLKEAAKRINMKKSSNIIKATAEKVNNQIQETMTEAIGVARVNAKEMQANAFKMAKEAIENIDVTERVGTIKTVVKNASDFTFETAEELVDGMISNGERWQNVAAKAMKSGLKLAERQQEITFSTLEAVKGQLGHTAVRLRNLFKNN